MSSSTSKTAIPKIFDGTRRRALRQRAASRAISCTAHTPFLWEYIATDMAERLHYISREFRDILIIGPLADLANIILADRDCRVTRAITGANQGIDNIIADEDRFDFPHTSFDLVICGGILDSINDLPGALVQIRQCLRPDGLFLGNIFGVGTLPRLKTAMLRADGDRPTPHIHPQIDLRNAADLLTRTGFALPVVDQDILPVRYSSLMRLIGDLRDMGVGNALSGARPYFGKNGMARLYDIWDQMTDSSGKVEETFTLIHMSGWAPSPDQPKPAKRGSGKISLANILKPGAE